VIISAFASARVVSVDAFVRARARMNGGANRPETFHFISFATSTMILATRRFGLAKSSRSTHAPRARRARSSPSRRDAGIIVDIAHEMNA